MKGKVAKDCVVFRYDNKPPGGCTAQSIAAEILDSLKCYGKCKVSHVWQGSGDTEYDSDGVQIFDKFAVVLKFEDICTANRVKQKYNGHVLAGLRVRTGWLTCKDITKFGVPQSELTPLTPHPPKPSHQLDQRYWYKDKDRPTRYSTRNRSPPPDRHGRKTLRGNKPYSSSSTEWTSASQSGGRSSPTYTLRSSRQHSPTAKPRQSVPSSVDPPPRSPPPTRTRRLSHTSSTHTTSPADSPHTGGSYRRSISSWGEEGVGEEEDPGERPTSSASTRSSLRLSSRNKSRSQSRSRGGRDEGKERERGGGNTTTELEEGEVVGDEVDSNHKAKPQDHPPTPDVGVVSPGFAGMQEKRMAIGSDGKPVDPSVLPTEGPPHGEPGSGSATTPPTLMSEGQLHPAQEDKVPSSTSSLAIHEVKREQLSPPPIDIYSTKDGKSHDRRSHDRKSHDRKSHDTYSQPPTHQGSTSSRRSFDEYAPLDTTDNPSSNATPHLISYPAPRGYARTPPAGPPERGRGMETNDKNDGGGGTSQFEPGAMSYGDYQPERMFYGDRDVTPPAEFLEASQQLAQGQYSDWCQLFEHEPHLFKQFMQYYSTEAERCKQTLQGTSGMRGGPREAAQDASKLPDISMLELKNILQQALPPVPPPDHVREGPLEYPPAPDRVGGGPLEGPLEYPPPDGVRDRPLEYPPPDGVRDQPLEYPPPDGVREYPAPDGVREYPAPDGVREYSPPDGVREYPAPGSHLYETGDSQEEAVQGEEFEARPSEGGGAVGRSSRNFDREEIGVGRSLGRDNVGMGRSRDDVGMRRSRDDVEMGRSRDNVEMGRSRDDVGMGRSRDDVEMGRSRDDVGMGRSRDDVGMGRSRDDVGMRRSRDDVEMGRSRDDVGMGRSRDDVGMGRSRDDVGMGRSRDDVGMGRSLGRDDVGMGRSLGRDDVGMGRSLGRDDVGMGRSLGRDDVGMGRSLGRDDIGVGRSLGRGGIGMGPGLGRDDIGVGRSLGRDDIGMGRSLGRDTIGMGRNLGRDDIGMGRGNTGMGGSMGREDIGMRRSLGRDDIGMGRSFRREETGAAAPSMGQGLYQGEWHVTEEEEDGGSVYMDIEEDEGYQPPLEAESENTDVLFLESQATVSNQLYGAETIKDPSNQLYGAETLKDSSNQLYGAETLKDSSDQLYGAETLKDSSNQLYGAETLKDSSDQLYGAETLKDPSNQLYGAETLKDPSNQLYGAETLKDPSNQLYGAETLKDPSNQLYGAEILKDPSNQLYGAETLKDPSDQLYGTEGALYDTDKAETGSGGVDMAVQTGLEELDLSVPSPGELRQVEERHTHLQEQAIRDFTNKSLTLITTAQTFISDNPALEAALMDSLVASLLKVSDTVETNMWDKIASATTSSSTTTTTSSMDTQGSNTMET